MTWVRLTHRNGLLQDQQSDMRWSVGVNQSRDNDATCGDVRRERLVAFEQQVRTLRDDVQRLKHDALDEDAVCAQIARRASIDPNVVAAVLKEFFAL